MDRYNSRFPLLFSPQGETRWAITLAQTTWYSVPESQVDPGWRRHEECHKRQWADHGLLRFAVRYLWQLATKGYLNIDYEIEARAAAELIDVRQKM